MLSIGKNEVNDNSYPDLSTFSDGQLIGYVLSEHSKPIDYISLSHELAKRLKFQSFANTPLSINEIRSEKEANGLKWLPRDVLTQMLRHIDKGEYNVQSLAVVYRRVEHDGMSVGWWSAGEKNVDLVGMLETAKYSILSQ